MKLLLDTQALLWWFNDDRRLGQQARSLIADRRSVVLVSVASLWEISLKHRIGKLEDHGAAVMEAARECDFSIVAIEQAHLAMLGEFVAKPDHRDPFDHLILVQAIVEEAILVTSDRALRDYGVRCI